MELWIKNTAELSGTINAPASKSWSIRGLFLSLYTKKPLILKNLLVCEDTFTAKKIVKDLAVEKTEIHTGDSGISTHFALAFCGTKKGIKKITLGEQMAGRKLAPFLNSLRLCGLTIKGKNPITLEGTFKGGEIKFLGKESQPTSALLMALPTCKKNSKIIVKNLRERPYVEMTIFWLKKAGIKISHTRQKNLDIFTIPGGQKYKSFTQKIPGDYSSVAPIIVAAAITKSKISISGLDENDVQGDKAILDILEKMGAKINWIGERVFVEGGSPLNGLKIDCKDIPDLVPILAVLGTYANGQTILKNAGHARLKETDRLKAITKGLKRMGAKIIEKEDELIIKKSLLKGASLSGENDHRTVMALVVAGLIAKGETKIDSAESLQKTYPNFTRDMLLLGAKMSELKPIAIMGFKSCGKTTFGSALAHKLKIPFTDLDAEIEKKIKQSCGNFVRKHGEKLFREKEHELLKKCLKMPLPRVIALGGGTPMDYRNQNLLKSCRCIYVDTAQKIIIDRILKQGIPAFIKSKGIVEVKKELQKLWTSRNKIYKKIANETVSKM